MGAPHDMFLLKLPCAYIYRRLLNLLIDLRNISSFCKDLALLKAIGHPHYVSNT